MVSRYDDDSTDRIEPPQDGLREQAPADPTRSGTPPVNPQLPQPQLYVGSSAQQQRPVRRRRGLPTACLGCAIIIGAMLLVSLCGLLAGSVIVWNNLSAQITAQLSKQFAEDTGGVASTNAPRFQTTYVYDRDGNELHQLFTEGRRTRIRLSEISKNLIDATVAVEDANFYDNPGVDMTAILRAGLNYFRAGGGGGASTITQQLVRNVVFDFAYRAERSARRKLEEVLMAVVLTRMKPKDEILELYLNTIYYGNLAYGIEAASQTYFGKSARDLTLAEAALLAGLPQSPATYDPLNPDPEVQEAVLARRNTVLDLMVDKGKIPAEIARQVRGEALTYANPNVNLKSPHFTLYAEQELQDLLSNINLPAAYLNTAGLSVYTTLDPRYQELAEGVARQQIGLIKTRHNANNAAVVIIHPATGEVLAIVGSVDYRDESIDGRVNMAIAPRQPGSAIKPLTYAAALERGISPASILWDVETVIDDGAGNTYAPVNYDRQFHGAVRLRDALANSYNIPAVKTLRMIGVDYLLQFAERVGIRSLGTDASQYGLSLTLGGGEVTPLELTRAYTVFANEGRLVQTTAILCIVNSEKTIIWQYQEGGCGDRGQMTNATITAAPAARQVLDPRIAFIIRDILGDNAARTPAMGSNSPLRTDGIASSVKTGTTNNYRDNWTVGVTRNVAIGVWVGNSDNAEMSGTTGLTGAAPIWNQIIRGIYSDPALLDRLKVYGGLLEDAPAKPEGVTAQRICAMSSLLDPAIDCELRRFEWLLDSPPLVPDPNGDLVPASIPAPTPPPPNAPLLIPFQTDPAVFQALVFPMNPAIAAALILPEPGKVVPPPPIYCLVPQNAAGTTIGAVAQLFIQSPSFPDEDVYARIYSQGAGIPILPQFVCSDEIVAAGAGGIVPGVVAQITQPRPGETVFGTVFVRGVASWGPGQAWYFKTEIQGPSFPEWTTFGSTSESPVVNGDLGNFGAGGLAPGMYQLRIVIVGVDGNYLMTSPPVPITVTGQ